MAALLKSKQHLKDYLILMSSASEQDPLEEVRLVKRVQEGQGTAFRALVEAYLPKVVSWVSPHRGGSLSFQELIAIGNLALLDAIKFWDKEDPLEERVRRSVQAAVKKALDSRN